MPAFHAIASVAPKSATAAAPAAVQGGAIGDAAVFGQALSAAYQDPTLAAFQPSKAQSGVSGAAGFVLRGGAHATPQVLQVLSNAAQSAAATPQTATAAQTAAATTSMMTDPATTATKAAATTLATTTPSSTTPTALQSAPTTASAQLAAAKANLKQQAAALKGQFQAQPVSTTASALAGMQTTLQNAPNAVSASTAASVTDLLKQASVGVTGGPGAMQAHLAKLNTQLNKIEARATGVDPGAPPQGWTEPPIFAQARSLLNALAGGTATTPAAMKASGDPLATAGLPIAGAPTPATTASTATPGTGPQSTGAALAQSAQTGEIAAALQATQATASVGATQLDPQMLKAAAAQSSTPLTGAPAQPAPSKEPARTNASDRDAQPATTTTVAQASAEAAKTVAPVTPTKTSSDDNNAALGAQVADQAALAAKDAKADDTTSTPVLSDAADAQAAQAQVQAQTSSQTQLQAQIAAQTQAAQTTVDPSHLAPQATAYLAAQMVKELGGRSTQFDLQLHPADLGRVDVQMKIEQDGRLNAQLAFDNPAAAAEFRGRSDELRQQLQQAGFQLSNDSLTFTERNPQGSGQQQGGGQQAQNGWDQPDLRTRAFQNSAINAQTADLAASSTSRVVTGLDMRV